MTILKAIGIALAAIFLAVVVVVEASLLFGAWIVGAILYMR